MPRKFIKKYMPNSQLIRENKHLGLISEHIGDSGLWHLNRRSVSGGVAIGLFMAWVPFPFQMVIAGAIAVFFRVNLPVSVALVWTTNPITIPPLFYAAYKLGAKILGMTPLSFELQMDMHWILERLTDIWIPMSLGCLLFATISSLIGYLTVRLLWRLALVRKWQARRNRKIKHKPRILS